MNNFVSQTMCRRLIHMSDRRDCYLDTSTLILDQRTKKSANVFKLSYQGVLNKYFRSRAKLNRDPNHC